MESAGVNDAQVSHTENLINKFTYSLSELGEHPHNVEIGFVINQRIKPVLRLVCSKKYCSSHVLELTYENWLAFTNFQVEFQINVFSRDVLNTRLNGAPETEDLHIQLGGPFFITLSPVSGSTENETFQLKIIMGDSSIVINELECRKIFHMRELFEYQLKQLESRDFPALYSELVGFVANSNLNDCDRFNTMTEGEKRIKILIEGEVRIGNILFYNELNQSALNALELVICFPDIFVRDVIRTRTLVEMFRRLNLSESGDSDYGDN